jgi:hypothetical protein
MTEAKILHCWPITSRKYGKKEPQSFSHYGYFDHPDLQSLKDCIFVFLVYDCNVGMLGACNTPLERCFQDLSSTILKAPKFLTFELVNYNNTNMQSFSDCRSGWLKELEWENNCGSFLPCFLLVNARGYGGTSCGNRHIQWLAKVFGQDACSTKWISNPTKVIIKL